MSKQQPILTAPHEQIEAIQLEGIKKTVVKCYENVPFYKKSFDDAGFDPYAVKDLDDLQKAPFVTKQDLRDNYPYGMFATPLSEVKEIHMSSGTTGVATVGGYTQHDLDIWGECFARGIEYANGGKDDVVHVCYGYGLFTGGLGAHYGGLYSGATTIPMSAGNTERQIRVLKEMGSTIICCTPSYARPSPGRRGLHPLSAMRPRNAARTTTDSTSSATGKSQKPTRSARRPKSGGSVREPT